MPPAADDDGKSAVLAERFTPVLVGSAAAPLLTTLDASPEFVFHNHNQQKSILVVNSQYSKSDLWPLSENSFLPIRLVIFPLIYGLTQIIYSFN